MLRYLLAGVAALAAATSANAETYAIQAGRLIVDAAQPERGPSTVVVENGRISRIESGFTAPAGAIVVAARRRPGQAGGIGVDEGSRTVMPGLIDVHVHLTQDSGRPWYQAITPKFSEPYAATVG